MSNTMSISFKPNKSEPEILFVTGIGTGVGKTVCSAVLTKYFNADYWKPIQSGDLSYSDTMKIKEWVGKDSICHPETYRLQLAASPHQSAAEENVHISVNDFTLPETTKNLVIEGAGGLMVPLSDQEFIIDLIEKLNIPAVLVVRNYLGCINHTLLSVMALRQSGIHLKYLILNGEFPADTERVICSFLPMHTEIIKIPDLTPIDQENIERVSKTIKIR